MMDFFAQQEKARKKTGLLVVFFVLAVALIIAALYVALAALLYAKEMVAGPWQPELFALVAAAVLAIVAGGSLYKTGQLRKGGAAVAGLLEAKPVLPDTRDAKERQLINVVEEMAIASGTPVPAVYLLEEGSINAFAAGWGVNDAILCLTRGALTHLSRDELQGVVAHEFSHVLNGDMRLNIRLMGVVFGILCIAQLGYWVLRGKSRVRVSAKGKGGGAAVIFLIALALFVIGYIGVFFGNLIKAAVSRSREFLADASAVQFTRNPSGIAGALKKIGGLEEGSRISHENAGQASHLFFASGLTSFWESLFATHPPLAERIRAIEPAFRGRFPKIGEPAPARGAPAVLEQAAASGASAAAGGPATASPAAACPEAKARPAAAAPAQRLDPAPLIASVGAPSPPHVAQAAKLIGGIPQAVRLAMMDKNGAEAAIFALLLSGEPKVRQRQLAAIEAMRPALAGRLAEIAPCLSGIDRKLRAPIAALAASPLKSLSTDYPRFKAALQAVIEADERLELFEYMIQRMVRRHLEPRFAASAEPKRQLSSLAPVAGECALVLSALAWETGKGQEEAGRAFDRGAAFFPGSGLALLEKERCAFAALDPALDRLDQLAPLLKKRFLAACVEAASCDKVITTDEVEYVRIIADAVGCPMPPLLAQA